MPLMERETHENLLNELLNSDIEHSRRSEILQELRVAHSTAHNEFESINTTSQKLQKDNDDLILSNSKLFRQLGVVGQDDKTQEKMKEKQVGETITIEDLEKGVR
jgi:hypothetical protein